MMFKSRIPLIFCFCLFLFNHAYSQDNPPTSREAMWPAPTAEDWKKPCLITWQRTWEDALAVAKETNKPIMVCVNMDGEIASEHYAGIRYRQPEIAKLYEPYVCVIASVYRHNPRDYDDEGKRILCPRFGCVTCGEHIAIESGLYEKFFDEQRVAPRHIGVELDGSEAYDVYYAFDTDSVFEAIRKGAENRPEPNPVVRGDRSIIERVASRDIRDRTAVHKAYKEGDQTLRRSLLEAAIKHPEAAQVDLLRLAVFGFDMELSKLARTALAKTESKDAVKLIDEALRVPMETTERDALISALSRLGGSSPKARMLAVVHKGLASKSSIVDVNMWSQGMDATDQPLDSSEIEARFEQQAVVFESDDAEAHLDLSEAFLFSAFEQPDTEQDFARCQFEDARQTALKAKSLGASGWRLNAIIGIAAYNLGDREEAYHHAEEALTRLPSDQVHKWEAFAVLDLFLKARRKAIADAVSGKREWAAWSKAFEGAMPWLTDVHAAYSVLSSHPYGADSYVMAHYDFLNLIGAKSQAAQALDKGIAQFSGSWGLHYRLRGRILRDMGLAGLEKVYNKMLQQENPYPNLEWFAGYASFVTAEFLRRRGKDSQAVAAYDRAIAHYDKEINAHPESQSSADHYVALALAGKGRVAYELDENEKALAYLLEAFDKKPEAAATLDGLNISPVDTAKMLRQRLRELKRDDLLQKLETALGKLDPKMLLLPAYEGQGPRRSRNSRRGKG